MNQRTYFLNILSFGVLTCFVFALVLRVQFTHRSPLRLPFAEFFYNYSLEEPLDAEQTCQFPNLDPYDPSIWPHLAAAEPIRCGGHNFPDFVFVDDDGLLRINRSALEETGYGWTSLSCDYQEVIRDDGSDENVHYGSAVPILRDGQPMDVEFAFVRCKNFAGFTVYSSLHVNVVRKPGLADRQEPKGIGSKPNVLMLVLDSVSRSNFIRQLPMTYKYLERELGAVVLRGMTKVGDNTFPNMVPVLTGLQAWYYPELAPLTGRQEGWPGFIHPQRYDDWPFVWKNFSSSGYATLLAEDKPNLSIFNYLEGGFEQPPTDHYMRPFWLALESSAVHMLSSNLCLGSKPKHQLQMDYMRRFTKTYARVPHFGFSMLTEISHDHMNQLGAADEDFLRFLRGLHQEGSLDNTFFVMMGDHGHRLDSIVETMVGSIERRMPIMAIYVPPWFRKSFPQAASHLQENGRRLTSMRDLHFTLLDIVKYAESGSGIGHHVRPVDGTTLFGPVPANRSCLQAGIPHQFCACDREQRVQEDHPGVSDAAAGLVDSINRLTEVHRKYCSLLELVGVRNAVLVTSYAPSNRTESSLEAWKKGLGLKFRISVEVKPSGGLFEGMAVIQKDRQPRIIEGTIRINRFQKHDDRLSIIRKVWETSFPAESTERKASENTLDQIRDFFQRSKDD